VLENEDKLQALSVILSIHGVCNGACSCINCIWMNTKQQSAPCTLDALYAYWQH